MANPLGAVVIADGGNPRTLTGIALETISGGQIVVVSGAFDAVSSGASSFKTSDIEVAQIVSAERANGVALRNATSGNEVVFLTRGAVIVPSLGSVLQGTSIEAVSADGVRSLSSGAVPTGLYAGVSANKVIGRALTAAGSVTAGNYALIDFSF